MQKKAPLPNLTVISNENQKLAERLKSENEELKKKNKQIDKNYHVKLNENIKLNKTISDLRSMKISKAGSLPNLSSISNRKPLPISQIGFYIKVPKFPTASCNGLSTAKSENLELLPKISGFFQLNLKWNKGQDDNPSIYITPMVKSKISCTLAVTVSIMEKNTAVRIYKSKR